MATIHLVSHTHWDREWYLPFQQFRLKLVHLVDQLLDIFEHDLDYRYFLLDGQAIILEDYLEVRPDREADLRRYISSGRLIIGPWYISPDEFLVSPESHIRNLLEGDRICRKFGAKMPIGYLPDTFGHIGQMPQILQGFGVDSACLFRGLDDQPVELIWEAPDGSRLLLSFLRESYSNAASLSTNDPAQFIREVNNLSQSLAPYAQTDQILLMHGTDHMEPTRNLPRAIHAYCNNLPKDNLVHSNLVEYFKAVRSVVTSTGMELPIVGGELRSPKRTPLLPNVLSTRIWIKQRNHASETNLVKWMEPLNAWNHFLDPMSRDESHSLPSTDNHQLINQSSLIHKAWTLLMQCHPHDSICGTSIDQVADEMRVRFDQVDQITQELISQNLQLISDHIDTTFVDFGSQSNPQYVLISSIIVFNPNDQPQSGLLNVNLKLDPRISSFEIVNDHNEIIPYHQKGLGLSELISAVMDKKGLRQSLAMIHEGNIAGLVIRDFQINTEGNKASIQATLSDHGLVDLNKWEQGVERLEEIFADPLIDEFIIRAYSDPEIDLDFIAREVPGHGYLRYWVRGSIQAIDKKPEPKKMSHLIQAILPAISLVTKLPLVTNLTKGRITKRSDHRPKIENEYFIVEARSLNGTLTIIDKRTQQVFSGLNQFVDVGDCGDVYNYSPPPQDRIMHGRKTQVDREINEVYQKLIVQIEMLIPRSLSTDRKSRCKSAIRHRIISTITLFPGVPRVDIHTEINNQAYDHRLRVHFPAPFGCTSAFYDGPFELVERTIELPEYDDSWVEFPRPEMPEQGFTLVRNNKIGLAIANRGLPEAEVLRLKNGNVEIAVTLLRCVGWLSRDDLITRKGHAGPMGIVTPGAQMVGSYFFDYSIIPGDDNIQPLLHQAYAFNAPLRAITTTLHPGSLSPDHVLIENSNPNFIITAIKQSEDGLSLIVRGYNMLPESIEVELKPFRVFKQVHIVSLDEKPVQSLHVAEDGRIIQKVNSHKILTIRFQD